MEESEPLISEPSIRRRPRHLYIAVTLLLLSLAMELYGLFMTQYVYKSTADRLFPNSFTFNNRHLSVCSVNKTSESYRERTAVQQTTAKWDMYKSLAEAVPAVLTNSVLGSFSDSTIICCAECTCNSHDESYPVKNDAPSQTRCFVCGNRCDGDMCQCDSQCRPEDHLHTHHSVVPRNGIPCVRCVLCTLHRPLDSFPLYSQTVGGGPGEYWFNPEEDTMQRRSILYPLTVSLRTGITSMKISLVLVGM